MAGRNLKTLIFTDTDSGGIIHVANIKGGVGKSTVATNLAAAFSKRGPTLVIDLDVQGSATTAFGFEPSEFSRSSWELFRTRFNLPVDTSRSVTNPLERMIAFFRRAESSLFPQIVGEGEITSLAVRAQPSLDLIPASADLFKQANFFHLQNLIYNLQICKQYYKYIILDTPSVWNSISRALFLCSSLNLIPVTLNALSTRSLRGYLKNIKKLAQDNPTVRIRIVKNEVFGSEESKLKGKAKTMNENRQFLESLCEQVVIKGGNGVSLFPQSIIFDLEIPDSAVVRNAQDEGKAVSDFLQYSPVARAFDELARRVQYVLNNPVVTFPKTLFSLTHHSLYTAAKVFACAVLALAFWYNEPLTGRVVLRPVAPQQLSFGENQVIVHRFETDESLQRIAKYAICWYRAVIPSLVQIRSYMDETVSLFNLTRLSGEKKIFNDIVPAGAVISFYPPLTIKNSREEKIRKVYRYFNAIVDDPFAYLTGDWCERGTGGGTPHYGIDVAANLGSRIISPIDGMIIIQDSKTAGKMCGIFRENMILFFAHMNYRYVKTGDKVKKGDVVGLVGMTGITSGPHVHVGYGLLSPAPAGFSFGRHDFKLTDPKLFFYQEQYLNNVEKQ